MPNLNTCPHCGERTFYETPTGRRCRNCGFTVKRPANGNAIKLRKRKIVTGIRNRACDYFYEYNVNYRKRY